jgi:hypothetical protein
MKTVRKRKATDRRKVDKPRKGTKSSRTRKGRSYSLDECTLDNYINAVLNNPRKKVILQINPPWTTNSSILASDLYDRIRERSLREQLSVAFVVHSRAYIAKGTVPQAWKSKSWGRVMERGGHLGNLYRAPPSGVRPSRWRPRPTTS